MFRNTTIGARLWFLIVVTNVLILIVGAFGMVGMSRSNDATHEIYEHQLSAAMHLAEARSNQLLVRILLDQATLAKDPSDARARAESAQGFARDSQTAWKAYLAVPRSAEEEQMTRDVSAKRDALFLQGVAPMVAALKAGDREAVMTSVLETIPKLDITLTAANGELSRAQMASARACTTNPSSATAGSWPGPPWCSSAA